MWRKFYFYELPALRPDSVVSHAQLPTPLVLENCVRVFFASRDSTQRSRVYAVDLHIDSDRVLAGREYWAPILDVGEIGTFDEHGAFPSCVVKADNVFYMYYIGWNKGVEPPLFYASIGRGISDDGLNFRKESAAPLLSRSPVDPCLVTSPHVFIDRGTWRMTYVSGVRWSRNPDGRLQSHYHIKQAESADGSSWLRNGRVAIDFGPGETNIARSTVLQWGPDDYRMWFSYVHSKIGKYRIGFARSPDGLVWHRSDQEAGIGCDERHALESICYPSAFRFQGRQYLLYNGDGFGIRGFGLAIWDEDVVAESP